MKTGLLERIQALGHWRVVVRPLVPLADTMNFSECFEVVDRNRVALRGWDFPHISRRQDDQGGNSRGEGYVENWCDWQGFHEFWRMYKSGQFLSYSVVHDDSEDDLKLGKPRWLNAVDAVYTVSEFVEFSHRLTNTSLYRDGYEIDISLRNTAGRRLYAGRGRIPFLDEQGSSMETIKMVRRVDPDKIRQGAIATSLSILLDLFDAFGWNPDPSQIRNDQEAFYRREFR
jgi:hypothetical protein